jgi:hypothetical protein
MYRLKDELGITDQYLREIILRSKDVTVSNAEASIVNKWTKIDVLIDMITNWNGRSYHERVQRMTYGKNDDYKLFVILQDDNRLTQKAIKYMKYSPCGKAKLDALQYRSK